jgi:hypothetical protein
LNDRLQVALLVGVVAGAIALLVRREVDRPECPRRGSGDTSSSEGSWSTASDSGSADTSDSGDSGGGDGGGD